jgi:hypothetical protein
MFRVGEVWYLCNKYCRYVSLVSGNLQVADKKKHHSVKTFSGWAGSSHVYTHTCAHIQVRTHTHTHVHTYTDQLFFSSLLSSI